MSGRDFADSCCVDLGDWWNTGDTIMPRRRRVREDQGGISVKGFEEHIGAVNVFEGNGWRQ